MGIARLCPLKQGRQGFSPLPWGIVIGCGLLPTLGGGGDAVGPFIWVSGPRGFPAAPQLSL